MEHNFPCSFSSCRREKSLSRPFEPIKSNALLHPDAGFEKKNEVAAVTPIHRRELWVLFSASRQKKTLSRRLPAKCIHSVKWLAALDCNSRWSERIYRNGEKKRVASRRDAQIERAPLATQMQFFCNLPQWLVLTPRPLRRSWLLQTVCRRRDAFHFLRITTSARHPINLIYRPRRPAKSNLRPRHDEKTSEGWGAQIAGSDISNARREPISW